MLGPVSVPPASDVEIPPVSPTVDLRIPNDVYEGLLKELREDPQLCAILNDFNPPDIGEIVDVEDNTDIGEIVDVEDNTDMWDSYDQQTPLERELLFQGY